MAAHSEEGSTADPASGAGQGWLGSAVWEAPDFRIQGVKSCGSISAVTYDRGSGESTFKGDKDRLVLRLNPAGQVLMQVDQGRQREVFCSPYSLGFFPADVKYRMVHAEARFVQVLWDPELCSTLLPELGAVASGFEAVCPFEDPLLSQIAITLTQQSEGGFAERILTESLGTALSIRMAQRFVGHLPLPTSKGLSPERLQRVRDYIEAHLDEDLSLTILADVACLSPYHFSRSFKQTTGVGLHHYVMQRRLERAKTLMRRTNQPLALIALEAGFADQSHLNSAFRREVGVTPGQFRAALA
jgi:AraC family transcriptional regulator